jgi:predicted phage terminase large subunit-like protein
LTLGFEDGQIYRAIEALLKKRMRERKMYPSIKVLPPITDKLARARVLQGRMQQSLVTFAAGAEWYETVRNEMLRFPAGRHDDCVDSLAWCARLAIGTEPPKPPKIKEMPSWKDKLRLSSANLSHMAA